VTDHPELADFRAIQEAMRLLHELLDADPDDRKKLRKMTMDIHRALDRLRPQALAREPPDQNTPVAT
jgi:hypothetical protein